MLKENLTLDEINKIDRFISENPVPGAYMEAHDFKKIRSIVIHIIILMEGIAYLELLL